VLPLLKLTFSLFPICLDPTLLASQRIKLKHSLQFFSSWRGGWGVWVMVTHAIT